MTPPKTIEEVLGPAMGILTQEEADVYFAKIVGSAMAFDKTREEAEGYVRESLGYYAGYYSLETRLRVERLFRCQHPVFGRAEEGVPSVEESFEMGKALARNSLDRSTKG